MFNFRSFRWKFNNSGETLDVGKERFHRNGSTSILQYTPVTDQVCQTYSYIPKYVFIARVVTKCGIYCPGFNINKGVSMNSINGRNEVENRIFCF